MQTYITEIIVYSDQTHYLINIKGIIRLIFHYTPWSNGIVDLPGATSISKLDNIRIG